MKKPFSDWVHVAVMPTYVIAFILGGIYRRLE